MKDLLKDKTGLIVVGVAITVVAVTIAITDGDLSAFGQYLMALLETK